MSELPNNLTARTAGAVIRFHEALSKSDIDDVLRGDIVSGFADRLISTLFIDVPGVAAALSDLDTAPAPGTE